MSAHSHGLGEQHLPLQAQLPGAWWSWDADPDTLPALGRGVSRGDARMRLGALGLRI